MGRFQQRHGGRGGRGRGNGGFSQKKKDSKPSQKKKTLQDCTCYLGSAGQASDCEITAEFIVNHVKKTFDHGGDIAKALREEAEVEFDTLRPALRTSTKSDEDEKTVENKQFEMEFKMEHDEFRKRKNVCERNKTKAHALLWERCAKGMQNKMQSRKTFESDIEDDPIELLKAVKEHALNYQENRHEMSIMLDSIRALVGAKQSDGESLVDHAKRFKTAKEVMVSHVGGPIILPKHAKNMDGCVQGDGSKTEELIGKAFDQMIAFLHLENADQQKHGSILKGLNTQKSLKNDQHPKSLIDANNVLSSHKFDNSKELSKKRKEEKKKNKENDEKDDAKGEALPQMTFAQLTGVCYCCGQPGHKVGGCDEKDSKPREEWHVNKVKKGEQAHSQVNNGKTATNDSESKETENTSKKLTGWVSAHVNLQFFQGEDLRRCVLLDNESTTSIFCCEDFVTNVREGHATVGLKTNGGILESNSQCDIPFLQGLQECWFNENAITNILAFHEARKLHRIACDNAVKNVFAVHLSDNLKSRFHEAPNGLCMWKPSKQECDTLCNKEHQAFVETVEENKVFRTADELRRAKRAREYLWSVGSPAIPDLLAMMRMNLVKDCPVTVDDVKLAETVCGSDVGTIKGKTTRKTPHAVVRDMIDIPAELVQAQKNVTLDIDGIAVNDTKFLTTISRKLCYRTAHCVSQRTTESYRVAVESLVRMHNQGGFLIKEIHCDNEFRPLMAPLGANHNIRMNFANPQDHVPRAERNNRTIKERVRCVCHQLPFDHLPRLMVRFMVAESTKKLNYFPAKHGVSKYCSPRMIVQHENLDCNKHCKHSFGQHVLGHNEPNPTNTNAPRALDCICLSFNSNDQGGHILLHLQTNAVVIRRRVTPVPITAAIAKQVHAIAEAEGMPKGLKIRNRFGEVLFDNAWIAGVDCEEEGFDDADYSSEEDDDEDDDDDDENEEDQWEQVDTNEIADVLDEQDQDEDEDEDEDENENDIEESEDEDEENQSVDERENDNQSEASEEENRDDDGDNPNLIEGKHCKTRAGRVTRAPDRMNMFATLENYGEVNVERSFHQADPDNPENRGEQGCTCQNAKVFMQVLKHCIETAPKEHAFVQAHSLKAGIKKWGKRAEDAALKEMKQSHDREVFAPVDLAEMTPDEIKRAMESLIFLVEKRDKSIKGRACANGSPQRQHIDREEAASPTASTDSIVIACVIDATQERDVMVADVPNAFVQTQINKERLMKGERILMKIRGILVDMLIEMDPEKHKPCVTSDAKGNKILCVMMLKALHGMLIASLLCCKKFLSDVKKIGFEPNPCDPCVANRIVKEKQHTITWHVDDTKSSHVNPRVNDDFKAWLERTCSEDGIGAVKVTRGTRHDYLAMTLDCSEKGTVKIDMTDCVKQMVEDFPHKVGEARCPWTDKLFIVDDKALTLDDERKSAFHTFVMKGMFVCKRGRQDIQPGIAFLCARAAEPNEGDWRKLVRLLSFLNKTKDDVLSLKADGENIARWHVDASFAVHKDCKSHAGATMTFGKGCITSISTKQKVNTRSSTEAELVGLDDVVTKIIWSAHFVEAQGFTGVKVVVNRDNMSSLKLEMNGKTSSGKRTRHFNIKHFYVADLIERKLIEVQCCPTDLMVADCCTKPLVGAKFKLFRAWAMGFAQPEDHLHSRSVLANKNKPDLNARAKEKSKNEARKPTRERMSDAEANKKDCVHAASSSGTKMGMLSTNQLSRDPKSMKSGARANTVTFSI